MLQDGQSVNQPDEPRVSSHIKQCSESQAYLADAVSRTFDEANERIRMHQFILESLRSELSGAVRTHQM